VATDTSLALLRAVAARCPYEPATSEPLERSVEFLGWPVRPATLLQAGDLVALVLAGCGWLVGAVVFGGGSIALLGAALVGSAVSTAVRCVPRLIGTWQRTRALGEAPGLVSRAVLRMRITPTPETAAVFAAETGRGRLAASLRAHVGRAAGAGHSGFRPFADEWASWFPSLRRALTLVESAGQAPPQERARALDSALEVTLDGTREMMATFASDVRGPAMAIYAFGVLLPLALVAMVPAAGTVGLNVSVLPVVLVYDVGLPLVLLTASAWLLSRRPVAFPPPAVSRSHPDVPDRQWPALALGVAAGLAASALSNRYVTDWLALLTGPGVGAGVALAWYFRPMERIRSQVREIEAGLPDALYLIGREVERGRAVETAMDDAAAAVGTATGELLADATRRQRQLKLGVRESLLGPHGALATTPSERTHSTAQLLALAASEGRPAGRAIVSMADHIDDLQAVEREARRELDRVTAPLSHTAAVFAPLVGGATVTLAEQMTTQGPLSGSPIAPATLGLAVGGYVLVLAALLATLSVGLERGLDRSIAGYRIGTTLVTATAVFALAVWTTDLLI